LQTRGPATANDLSPSLVVVLTWDEAKELVTDREENGINVWDAGRPKSKVK